MGLATLREGERRRETATGNEVGVGKEFCERPKPSSSSDVSFERRRREAASRRAVEENQSSVTGRSRCRGKAAAPNERRHHHVVKFELKPVVYREVPCDGQ
jgi:hypothetical protein